MVAGGEQRLEELLIEDEEKATPSPFQVSPPANVDAELEQLWAEVVRIRFPVLPTLEANQIPADNQESGSWMNLHAVDLRVAIKNNNGGAKVAINHALGRRATPTPRFGGRSPFEGEVPSCARQARSVRTILMASGLCVPTRLYTSDDEPVVRMGEGRNVMPRVADHSLGSVRGRTPRPTHISSSLFKFLNRGRCGHDRGRHRQQRQWPPAECPLGGT